MDLEQGKELQKLTQRAHAALCADSWRLRLAVLPSFDNSLVVGVLRDRPTSIVARIWQRHQDLRKLTSPVERLKHPATLEPTVTEMCVDDLNAVAENSLRCLHDLHLVTLPAHRRISLDGTRHSLLVSDSNFELNLSWTTPGPDEWRPVADWFDQTKAAFCKALSFDAINQEAVSGF